MRLSLIFLFSIIISKIGHTQVLFDIRQLPEQNSFRVLAVPDETYTYPSNLIGHIQVVLRYDATLNFSPVIKSLVPGVHWEISAEVADLPASHGYSYICVTSVERGISAIPVIKNVSIPLFEIAQADGSCLGQLHLCDNKAPDIMALRKAGLNLTQNFSMLGVGGNAFSGVINPYAQCDEVEHTDQDIIIQPNPADEWVSISWFFGNLTKLPSKMDLVIYHITGVEMGRVAIDTRKVVQEHTFIVNDWPAGAYVIKILPDKNKIYPAKKFLVIH